MALEDVIVVFQLFGNSGQRGVNLRVLRLPILHETHRNIVLLCFDIEQVVDGNRKVVATHVVVADGDRDVFLLLGRVAQKLLHAVAQVPVVVDDDGQRGNDNPDNHRPIQESEEEPERDGVLEYKREQDEIADGNK